MRLCVVNFAIIWRWRRLRFLNDFLCVIFKETFYRRFGSCWRLCRVDRYIVNDVSKFDSVFVFRVKLSGAQLWKRQISQKLCNFCFFGKPSVVGFICWNVSGRISFFDLLQYQVNHDQYDRCFWAMYVLFSREVFTRFVLFFLRQYLLRWCWLQLLTCVLEVPCSNLGSDIGLACGSYRVLLVFHVVILIRRWSGSNHWRVLEGARFA